MATPATTAMQTRAVAPLESSKLSAEAEAVGAEAAAAEAPAAAILRVRLLKTKRA